MVVCFIVNNAVKQKAVYCGIPVRPFERKIYHSGKSIFIIVSQKRGKEIQDMLARQDVRPEDIVCYVQKNAYYYQCLRPEFCDEENKGE